MFSTLSLSQVTKSSQNVSKSSLWNSFSFLVEQPKSAIKLGLFNWPPWITASAKNSIPTWPHWSSLNYLNRFPWFIASIILRKFCSITQIFKVSTCCLVSENYLRKSPFFWPNLHLWTLKIIIHRKQQKVQYRLSLPLASHFKRCEKQGDFWHQIISQAVFDCSCNIFLYWSMCNKIVQPVGLFLVLTGHF